MSVLNAFLATWSNARQTFGAGSPEGGAQFDSSPTLRQLESDVQSAAPGSRWTGTASSAYETANQDHGRVLGQMAGLDQRVAAEVDRSAQLIVAGRRDLDAVRKWVVDAASSVPQNAAGERMLLPIVQKGIGQLIDIIQRSNGDLNAIGGTIRAIGEEYHALGNQKFAPKEGGEFIGPPDQTRTLVERPRRTSKTRSAATKRPRNASDEVLGGIKPGQELTAEQGSYLSQLQAQQNGMSVEELKTAEQRLGDHKDIIGDSWQLMSNDDVRFPKTATDVDALDDPNTRVKGGFDQLPQSVQESLHNAGDLTPMDDTNVLKHDQDLQAISQIVRGW